jgi:hypothetical protein
MTEELVREIYPRMSMKLERRTHKKLNEKTASFLYPKSSLHFSSEKIALIVGCAEVRSASGGAWIGALPNVSTSYNDS